jgi:hypothetical protein
MDPRKRFHTVMGGGRMNVANPEIWDVICQQARPSPSESTRSQSRLPGDEDFDEGKWSMFINKSTLLESTNGAQNQTEAESDQ